MLSQYKQIAQTSYGSIVSIDDKFFLSTLNHFFQVQVSTKYDLLRASLSTV